MQQLICGSHLPVARAVAMFQDEQQVAAAREDRLGAAQQPQRVVAGIDIQQCGMSGLKHLRAGAITVQECGPTKG